MSKCLNCNAVVTAKQMSPQAMIRAQALADTKLYWEADGLTEDSDKVSDYVVDYLKEFRRDWQHETRIACDTSRCYESKSVARQLKNGVWVGWTYWFGGGKHGEPGSVDWIEDAYFLAVREVVVKKLEFSKRSAASEGAKS